MSQKLFDSVTNIKKDKLVVVGVAVIAVILLMVYIFGNDSEIATNEGQFFLTENGEASNINMSIPKTNTQVKDTSLLDAYHTAKMDSINRVRASEEGIGISGNSMLFQNQGKKAPSEKDFEKDADMLQTEMELQNMMISNSIASNSSASKPKPSNSHNVYGDYSMWETENKKSKSTASKSKAKKQEVEEWEDEEEEEEEYTPKIQVQKRSSATTKTKKKSFEDLPETEQRRLLLQNGGRYQESESIQAKILSSGTVKNGQTIRIMTQEVANLDYNVIPSGTIISGIVNFNDNRMNVELSTIRLKNKIIKVDLVVYSMDGLKGFAVDYENHTQEVEDEGITEVVQSTGRLGRIGGSILKSTRKQREISIDLGRDVRCLLVNRNFEN